MKNLVFGFFLLTALLRILGAILPFFPLGFSPLQSLALFSTNLIKKSWLAYLFVPLILFSTDAIINFFFSHHFTLFYQGFYWQYLSFFLMTFLGKHLLKTLSFQRTLIATFSGTSLFFIISNFGVFISSHLYAFNFQGLLTCYDMALPFYLKDLAINAFFSLGIYFVLKEKIVLKNTAGSRDQVAG